MTFLLPFLVFSVLLSSLDSAPAKKGNNDCLDCSEFSDWVATGNLDPHISVTLKRSSLDRRVCYDINGNSGDVFRLFRVGNLMNVDAELVKSPRHKNMNETYFEKFTFTTKKTTIIVTPYYVQVLNGTIRGRHMPWRSHVVKHHSTFYSDPESDFHVHHHKRKVVLVSFQGSQFIINKSLLKYGKEKKKFFYLGIYLEANEGTTYGGVIGEVLNKKATHIEKDGHDFLQLENQPKLIKVDSRERVDLLKSETFQCWFVSDFTLLIDQPIQQLMTLAEAARPAAARKVVDVTV